MIWVPELVADIKRGTIKDVGEYGASIIARAVPSVAVIPNNGIQGDTYSFQIWVYFPIGRQKELDAYVRQELPQLLALRRDHCRKRIWRYGNNYDSVLAVQENKQNFLRAGLSVLLPKVLRGYSADIQA